MTGTLPTPFAQYTEIVSPETVDYNGHMNIGYYLLSFENAARALFTYLDLSEQYRARTNRALFAMEAHLTFEEEVHEADALRFESQILGATDKALNAIHVMYRNNGSKPAATNEVLYLHVNLNSRRSEAFPPLVKARLQNLVHAHSALPRPRQAGRAIRLGR